MSKKSKSTAEEVLDVSTQASELQELSRNIISKTNKLTELEQRLKRLEKHYKSSERLGRSLAECLATQVVAIDAVGEVVQRSLTSDALVHEALQDAIKRYDKHKFRRWLSGFLGVLLWIGSVTAAACVGAFIYWLFATN